MKILQNLISKVVKRAFHSSRMTNSRYEYVKDFELDDKILPSVWIVVRVDGKSFHKFADVHEFEKPNDLRGLSLMNYAAVAVMKEFTDIVLAYGQSDEYSFVFHKTTALYNRRSAKIMSNVNSLFTSAYVYNWNHWFQDKPLKYTPSFDARVVLYPNDETIKDYLSWRQADVHINNLYNTVFWNLVLQGNLTNVEAEARLRGTLSAEKNEILFSQFDINYNKLPPMYRKGTILLRKDIPLPNHAGNDEQQKIKTRQLIVPIYDDLIKEKFWEEHSEILVKSKPQKYQFAMQSGEYEPVYPDIVLEQIKKLKLS